MLSFGANKNKKNIQYASVLLLLILVGGVAFPHPVHAVDILGMFGDGVAGVFKSLLWGVFSMVGGLLSGAVTIFQYAVDPAVYGPTGLFNKASVYNMWKLIRDFLNLFFILTLLYTAFTIVFQIASNYKKTLLSIVLAALFVNFSFPLTRVIIDATNVPMYYFINLILDSGKSNPNLPIAVGQGALGPALSASGLKDILIPPQNSLLSETITVAQLLMAIVFLFVFMVTLMVLAVMFVIRMMALLLLVIFSPIGFAASVIPGLKQYSAMWWDKLWKYAFFGPAAMLMLYIATQFFEEIAMDDTKMNMKLATQNNIASTGSDFFASMGMYSITIIMLWMAIGLANSMSIAGAGAVAGTGEKFLKWAGRKSTVSPAKFVGHKVDSKLAGSKHLSFLSPGSWALALKQRGEEQKHKDEQPIKQAAARRQDQLNQVISRFASPIKSYKAGRGVDHTDHEFSEIQKQASTYKKEISDTSTQSDYVMNELKAAIATKNKAKADAALQILAKGNDLNDLVLTLGGEYGAEKDANGNVQVSTKSILTVLEKILQASGETDKEMIAKKAMVISDEATGSGNFAFGGLAKFNADEHKFEMQTPEGHAMWAGGKVKNLETQKRQTTIHPDSIFKRYVDQDGKAHFGDINGDTGKAIISTFTNGDIEEAKRSRDDLKQAMYDGYKNLDKPTHAGFTEVYNNNQIFQDYVKKIVALKEAKPRAEGEKTQAEILAEMKEKRKSKGATF